MRRVHSIPLALVIVLAIGVCGLWWLRITRESFQDASAIVARSRENPLTELRDDARASIGAIQEVTTALKDKLQRMAPPGEFVLVRNEAHGYTIDVPKGWVRDEAVSAETSLFVVGSEKEFYVFVQRAVDPDGTAPVVQADADESLPFVQKTIRIGDELFLVHVGRPSAFADIMAPTVDHILASMKPITEPLTTNDHEEENTTNTAPE